MWKTSYQVLILLLLFTLLTGVLYPLAVTGLAQFILADPANGSLLRYNGMVAGSALIGQNFQSSRYFHGRPSASNYDALASGGSNLAPTNRRLIETVRERAAALRSENRMPVARPLPADLVTTSASGLDPHISPEGAILQALRVAQARRLPIKAVRQLIRQSVEYPFLGIFGAPRVNVLRLNLALDAWQAGGELR